MFLVETPVGLSMTTSPVGRFVLFRREMTKDRAGRTRRIDLVDPDATARPVFVSAGRHERLTSPWHAHRRAQFVHVSAGVLKVATRTACYVVPPQRGVWVAPGVEHRIRSPTPFWLTTFYVEPDLVPDAERTRVAAVDRLTDELPIEASGFGGDDPETGAQARVIAVLLDRLPALETIDVVLPEPSDAPLRRLCDLLLADPARNEPLSEVAGRVALTERTAARLLLRDTGLTFGTWRRHMKQQAALVHLAEGANVTQAAFAVGYADVSSFIAAFEAFFGKTPAPKRSASIGAIIVWVANMPAISRTITETPNPVAGCRSAPKRSVGRTRRPPERSRTTRATSRANTAVPTPTRTNIGRHPTVAPSQAASGTPTTDAMVMPENTTARACPWRNGRSSGGGASVRSNDPDWNCPSDASPSGKGWTCRSGRQVILEIDCRYSRHSHDEYEGDRPQSPRLARRPARGRERDAGGGPSRGEPAGAVGAARASARSLR